MSFLQPDVTQQQTQSQASPLAQDTLQALRANIGGLEQGLSTSRQAGTAIRQFVESGPNRLPEQQRNALEATQAQTRESALDQIAEEMSISGNALGSARGFATAETMSRLIPRQTQQLFQEERRRANQRLRGIGQMARIGQQNMRPFLELASQGILPEQTIVRQSPFMLGIQGLSGLARGAGSIAAGV